MAKRSYTVGVIGLGFGRAHIPAFQAHGCEVIAVCQRDQASATAIAKRYGVPQVFERWEEMLERARPRRRLSPRRRRSIARSRSRPSPRAPTCSARSRSP